MTDVLAPSPRRSTSSPVKPDPSRSSVQNGAISSPPPIFPYQETIDVSVNTPFVPFVRSRRSTSYPETKPIHSRKVVSWLPTFTQPNRPIVYASTVGLELAEPVSVSAQWVYSEFNVGYFNMMLFNG